MSFRLRWGLCALLGASALGSPGLALGGGPATQAAPNQPGKPLPAPATAADHVRRGDQARWARRWADAVAAYQDALKITGEAALPVDKRAGVVGELGLCELALGKHRDAAEHLYAALEQTRVLPTEQQRRFEEGQKKAEPEIARLLIWVDPQAAEVLVDGKRVGAGEAMYRVFVEPGSHTVRARRAGYEDGLTTLDAPKGTWPALNMKLARTSAAPVAQARADIPRPPAPAPSREESSSDSAATYRKIGLITASGGVVLGVGFAVSGVVLDNEVEDRSSALARRAGNNFSVCLDATFKEECGQLHALIRRRDAVDGIALGSFIASGVIGAVTLSSLWWAPGDGARAPIEVTPIVTGKHAGAVLHGVW